MRPSRSNRCGLIVCALVLALGAGGAVAQTPQTIVLDGVNDFLPGNLVDADGGDTQFPNIDLVDVYATNDAINLYLGIGHDHAGWSSVQLGVAIDVGTAGGGTTDPWGRAIEWSTAANKPDFMFYVNLDNNWQAGYYWDGAAWVGLGGAGPGALGWVTSTGFRELAIQLADLGVGPGANIGWECWVTQDGGTKGPLDLLHQDGLQLSTPGFTLWDTASPIPLADYAPYAVQAAADPDPPVVTNMFPTSFPVGTAFTVQFNEPIDPASITNWGAQFTDSQGFGVTGGTVVGSQARLTFDTAFTGSDELHVITVSGVEDLAGNPIVEDGTANTVAIGVKDVTFRGKFGPFLGTQGGGPHSFSVEGSKGPLTWDPICDTGIMVDTGVDDVWEYSTVMSWLSTAAAPTQAFEWKFNYDCGQYEPLASNRQHTLDVANGAADVLEFWWNDEDPSAFTARDIVVEIFVDMSLSAYLPGDVVAINGNALPLTFDVPSVNPLVDDGTGNDAAPGDGIFSTAITFPAGSTKDVLYKFLLNGVYECDGQGDRTLFLNDEVFGDGLNGGDPLVLPTVYFDYCTATWSDVEVVFSVDFNNTAWSTIGPGDVVTVNGTPNAAGTFNWDVPSLTVLHDDGVAPDAVAGDRIYTASVVFGAGSTQDTEYKYLVNDQYECSTQGNRVVAILPDLHDASGNPQVLATDKFQVCNVSGVPGARGAGLVLAQNAPNPFNPNTAIAFSVVRGGEGSLRVFNVKGELVRTLRAGRFAAGEHVATWDGRGDDGALVGSGVYFYRLAVGAESLTKRMILLK